MKKSSGGWELVASILAGLTVISAFVVIPAFGVNKVEVFGPFGISRGVERVFDWPLIVFCIVSALYSLLFAAVVYSLKRTENIVIDIATQLNPKGSNSFENAPLYEEECSENTKDMPA